jgi:hypothetical protein
MYQKNHSGGSNLPYSASPSAAAWYSSNYHHQPPNAAQFLGDSEGPPQTVYYPHHVFHQSSPDWAGHENYAGPPQSGSLLQGPGSGNNGLGGPAGFLSINQSTQNGNHNNEHINDGLQSLPSPPITVSGSDMSSPGAPNGSSSPQLHSRPTPVKSPYEWMKKPSYQSQPNPGKKNSTLLILCLCWKFVVETFFDGSSQRFLNSQDWTRNNDSESEIWTVSSLVTVEVDDDQQFNFSPTHTNKHSRQTILWSILARFHPMLIKELKHVPSFILRSVSIQFDLRLWKCLLDGS